MRPILLASLLVAAPYVQADVGDVPAGVETLKKGGVASPEP
jgi:hypothetical protein